MLDARTSEESVSIEHFDTAHPVGEAHNRSEQNQDNQVGPQERPQMKMITEDEIVGQAFVFLVAGYETSSNTLAFACYLLAINPECQHELQKEVDHFFTRHVSEAVCHHVNLCHIKRKISNCLLMQESPDYTNVQELKYLDMVISETLRLYPPGFR